MDLIDKQGGAKAVALQPFLGRIHFNPQILDPCQHGIQAAEMRSRASGNDSGQGGFAHAGGAVQDQIADPIGGDGSPQQAPLAKDSFLANEVVQGLGPQPIGQGGHLGQDRFAVVPKQVTQGPSRLLGAIGAYSHHRAYGDTLRPWAPFPQS